MTNEASDFRFGGPKQTQREYCSDHRGGGDKRSDHRVARNSIFSL